MTIIRRILGWKRSTGTAFVLGLLMTSLPLLSTFGSEQAWASVQLYINNSTSSGTDPTLISNTSSISMGINNQNYTVQSPLLIIVGVYDGKGTPSITFNNSALSLASIGTDGLTGNNVDWTSTGASTAYQALGLVGANSSESFVNWSGGDTTNGFSKPTNFELYAFQVNTSLTSGSPITFGESGAAFGSYILGYGESISGSKTTYFATPFTTTGMAVPNIPGTPEPGTWVLFGTGLLGMMGWTLRKKKALQS